MKNKLYISLIFVVAASVLAVNFLLPRKVEAPADKKQDTKNKTQVTGNIQNTTNNSQEIKPLKTVDPIEGALARITKKPFGILISPKTSPVQPERFAGYHTGVDFETTAEEQNLDVQVKAFCDGKLLMARAASGYGGVAVQACNLDGQAVTVVYGHIKLASMILKIGDDLKAGDFLAILGKGNSSETDGERKHLHLAIHKGNSINILGYVKNESQLDEWVDPAKYLQ